MADYCMHDLHPQTCGDCLGIREESEWNHDGDFSAKYGARCGDKTCRVAIQEGQEISRWSNDGSVTYTHKECSP